MSEDRDAEVILEAVAWIANACNTRHAMSWRRKCMMNDGFGVAWSGFVSTPAVSVDCMIVGQH